MYRNNLKVYHKFQILLFIMETFPVEIDIRSGEKSDQAVFSSIRLPASLFSDVVVVSASGGSAVAVVVTAYESPTLFPLASGSLPNIQIRSSVIGLLIGGVPPLRGLRDPIRIFFRLNLGTVSFILWSIHRSV